MIDYNEAIYDLELLKAYDKGYEFGIINHESYVLFFNTLIMNYDVKISRVNKAYNIYECNRFNIMLNSIMNFILKE